MVVFDEYGRVLVEVDVAVVGMALLFFCAHDHVFDDVVFFDVGIGDGVFYCGDEDVVD